MNLTPRQEELGLLGLGALGVIGSAALLWPRPARERVALAALSHMGSNNAAEFWKEVLPNYPAKDYPKDWCGGFALAMLHEAGLARDVPWIVGQGFMFRIPRTNMPKVGDMAYFDTNQHQAVVVGYDAATDRVQLVNGNGIGGAVTPSTHLRNAASAYYSIEPWVKEADANAVLPWVAASAALASAAAWVLIPKR